MELLVGVAAAVAAIASAVFIWFEVEEMKRQAKLQRTVVEAGAQPYVWADVDIQSPNGWNLELVVGNSGPTTATNVRVTIDPPFAATRDSEHLVLVHSKLRTGLASLDPGRRLYWALGPSADLIKGDGPLAHAISIDCDGPYGPVGRSEYVIDLADFRESIAKRWGSMHEIAQAIDKAAAKLPDPRRPVPVRVFQVPKVLRGGLQGAKYRFLQTTTVRDDGALPMWPPGISDLRWGRSACVAKGVGTCMRRVGGR